MFFYIRRCAEEIATVYKQYPAEPFKYLEPRLLSALYMFLVSCTFLAMFNAYLVHDVVKSVAMVWLYSVLVVVYLF